MKAAAVLCVAFLTGWPMAALAQDDHGNTQATATVVDANSTTAGRLETRLDVDYFRFELPSAGRLTVQTTGGTDTLGTLIKGSEHNYYDEDDDDSGSGSNFRFTVGVVKAGTWYVEVRGYNETGPYSMQVEFSAGAGVEIGQNTHALPLVRPADHAGQESLVRIVNRSGAGSVQVTAFDETGERFGPVTLTLGSRQSVNITSSDLEHGNAAKGLPVGVGDGEGDWWLVLKTSLAVIPLSYIRAPDGPLTSMHDVAPLGYRAPDDWDII